MTDKEFIVEMRRRINPVYADSRGSESWERKRALAIIDRRGEEVARLQAQLDELLAAVKPFADIVIGTSGRIPTERLSLVDWCVLTNAFSSATKDQV